MATVTSAITMITKPSIAESMKKFTSRRNQGGFFVQCYNCYRYDHFAKHCKMQGPVKVWRRKQVQSNDMNNHHPTKVWRIKLVYQNINDENI